MTILDDDASAAPLYHTGPQGQKKRGRTVIAHISDLHFTSKTDHTKDVWHALTADLRAFDVDLLVVTGDLIDSSFRDNARQAGVALSFDNVKKYLTWLCEKVLNIDPEHGLAVVPGNHDYWVKGIHSWDFGSGRLRRLQQFLGDGQDELFRRRFAEHYLPKFLPGLRCCLFTFDSNTLDLGLNFASGRINHDDIDRFSDLCRVMRQEHPADWHKCTKVALVHHHPMPIAATEVGASFIDSEKYHLLKNAGLFMTEMVNQKIDLVLHGHKHYPAYSRAAFPIGGDEHTISVIAAGSASSHGRPPSYNIITIEDNGNITLERRTRQERPYKQHSPALPLQPYESTRRERFARLAAGAGASLRVGKYTRVDTIRAGSGDDEIREEYESVTAYRPEQLVDAIPSAYNSRSGFIPEPRFGARPPARRRVAWKNDMLVRENGRNRRHGWLLFDPPLAKQPVDFDGDTIIHNAIHFNREDRLAVTRRGDEISGTRGEGEESVYEHISEVYELFTFKACLPMGFKAKNLRLEVWRPKDRLVGAGPEDDPEEDRERYQRDAAEEEYAGRRFTSFAADNTALLIIDRPLPGYRYKIVWGLPENELEEMHRFGPANRLHANDLIKRLLSLRPGGDAPRAELVGSLLNGLRAKLNATTVGTHALGADDLVVSVHAHDRTGGSLVCVATTAEGPERERLFGQAIGVGETIIGQAYRRREYVRWVSKGNPEIDLAAHFDYDHDDDHGHTGLVSVPLFLPVEDGFKVGVVTLATRSGSAPMLRLLEQKVTTDRQAAFVTMVMMVVAWYARKLSAALSSSLPEEPAPPSA